MLASPLTTLSRGRDGSDVAEVLRLAAENDVGEIVVGMPISLSGRRGPQADRVARFADALRRAADIPVLSADERYSTVQAERALRESGVEPSRERDVWTPPQRRSPTVLPGREAARGLGPHHHLDLGGGFH